MTARFVDTCSTASADEAVRRHEPLTNTAWDEERARLAIREIVADAEAAFRPDSLWPNHPLDDFEEKSPPQRSLYFGAAGMLWALHELARTNDVGLERDYSRTAGQLHDGYVAEPDDFGEEPAPSYLLGESGILLAAERWSPTPSAATSFWRRCVRTRRARYAS